MAEKLRVLMINGSPRANGNTSVGLKEMEKIFQEKWSRSRDSSCWK